MRAAIERYQPYNRPHPDLPPLLSVLRELSNRDKHKLLSLAFQGVVAAQAGMDFSGANPPITQGDFEVVEASSGEIDDGTEIGAMIFKRPMDHLVYAIACHDAFPKSPSHEGRLQFPITDDRATFDDAVICRKQLGTISDPDSERTAILTRSRIRRPPYTAVPWAVFAHQYLPSWSQHCLAVPVKAGHFSRCSLP